MPVLYILTCFLAKPEIQLLEFAFKKDIVTDEVLGYSGGGFKGSVDYQVQEGFVGLVPYACKDGQGEICDAGC